MRSINKTGFRISDLQSIASSETDLIAEISVLRFHFFRFFFFFWGGGGGGETTTKGVKNSA